MRKHAVCLLILTLLVCVLLSGCDGKDEKAKYQIFYLNMDVTKVEPVDYEPGSTGDTALVQELLDQLATEPEAGDLRQVIPGGVQVLNFTFNGYLLSLDFNDAYYNMSPTEEVLCRAAIVRTLLQVESISYVNFTVGGTALTDLNGKLVGSMNEESFVENPGQQINASNSATLTLYFASKDGTSLEKETRVVHYSTNISFEKLVMEQLLEGPKSSGLQSAIPSETKLITISVVDGVCYVNLDETFQNQNDVITEQVVLYSIVDSLTELPNVNKVQLSINGDTSGKVRYMYDLATMYEADLSYVTEEEEPDDTDTTEQPEQDTTRTEDMNNGQQSPMGQ